MKPELRVISAESSPAAYYFSAYFWMGADAVYAIYWLIEVAVPNQLPAFALEQTFSLIPKLKAEYVELVPVAGRGPAAWYVQAYAGCAALLVFLSAIYYLIATPLLIFLGAPVQQPPAARPNISMVCGALVLVAFVCWFPIPHDPREHSRVLPANAVGLSMIVLIFYVTFVLIAYQCILAWQSVRYGITRLRRLSEPTPS